MSALHNITASKAICLVDGHLVVKVTALTDDQTIQLTAPETQPWMTVGMSLVLVSQRLGLK